MVKKLKKKSIKWWTRTISYLTLFVIIVVFSFMKMSFIMKGVEIKAEINKDQSSPIVEIKGNAKNATYLSINGREIFIDKDGTFKESLALLPGYSVIGLSAYDKFGKTSEKQFEVIYEESAPAIAFENN